MRKLFVLVSALVLLASFAGSALADTTALVYKGKTKMIGQAAVTGTADGFYGKTSGTVYMLMEYDDVAGTIGTAYYIEYWTFPFEPTKGAHSQVYNLEVFYGTRLGSTSPALTVSIFSFDLNNQAVIPTADAETVMLQGKLSLDKNTGVSYPKSLKGYGTGMRTMNYLGVDHDVVAAGPISFKLDKNWTLHAGANGVTATRDAIVADLESQGVIFAPF